MSWQIEFRPEAEEDLARLETHIAQRVFSKLRWLGENCDLVNHKPLSGEFSRLFNLRIGKYRAIYGIDLDLKLITVHFVGHRKDIYKQS